MKILLVIVVSFILLVVGLTLYLGPNDLAGCPGAPDQTKRCEKADAVVAVSGGDTAARAREAIKLYQRGWASKIIFSGAAQDKSGPSNAEVMRREALAAGVAQDDIIIEEYSETTKQNAVNAQSIFEQNNIQSVILVTSGYHQRRAGLEFSKRSAGVASVRNHPVSSDNQWSMWWWATPTGWFLAVSEIVKVVIFYIGATR